MELLNIQDYPGGWFVGNFSPAIIQSKDVEVCIKDFVAGATEPRHFQISSVEVTVVVRGRCRMGECILSAGSALVVQPGEVLDFEALEDCTVIAVKSPSLPGDKVIEGHQVV